MNPAPSSSTTATRGASQYTSLDFTNHLRELGLVPSYGSTGDCYDNAAMETFWAALKRELSWMHGPLIYMSRSRLRSALFDYIEIFYNRERAQAGLGHLSPLDYEALDYEASLVVA
ncbi:MAG: IS3 family transposase [Acidimicrobiales bacterium]|nr:IS3 family transposase [Acidimicrobiales bacterium]